MFPDWAEQTCGRLGPDLECSLGTKVSIRPEQEQGSNQPATCHGLSGLTLSAMPAWHPTVKLARREGYRPCRPPDQAPPTPRERFVCPEGACHRAFAESVGLPARLRPGHKRDRGILA